MKTTLIGTLLALATLLPGQASASPAVCSEVGGAVIFKNTLYGAGTGLVVTGLGLLASNGGGDHAGQVLAGGTLLGATVGMGFGVADLVTRDCQPAAGIEIIPVFSAQGRPGAGLSWTIPLSD